MKRNRRAGLVASLATVCLLTAGCLQSSDDSGDSGDSSGGDSGGTAGAGGTDPNDGEVEIFGAFGADEAKSFNKSMTDFEEVAASTSSTRQPGLHDPHPQLGCSRRPRHRTSRFFPQPGLLLQFQDDITPIEDVVDIDTIEEHPDPRLPRVRRRRGRAPSTAPRSGWPSRASSGFRRVPGKTPATPPSRSRCRSSRASVTRSRPTASRRGASASRTAEPPVGSAPTGSRSSCSA